jgi:hypothetical protein
MDLLPSYESSDDSDNQPQDHSHVEVKVDKAEEQADQVQEPVIDSTMTSGFNSVEDISAEDAQLKEFMREIEQDTVEDVPETEAEPVVDDTPELPDDALTHIRNILRARNFLRPRSLIPAEPKAECDPELQVHPPKAGQNINMDIVQRKRGSL